MTKIPIPAFKMYLFIALEEMQTHCKTLEEHMKTDRVVGRDAAQILHAAGKLVYALGQCSGSQYLDTTQKFPSKE